jgi:hypothetical protein
MTWHGTYSKDATQTLREAKRREAEQRDAVAKPERRKAFRLGPVPDGGARTLRSIRRHEKGTSEDS